MRPRLSAKKLVFATYLQYISAGGEGARRKLGLERRALPSRRGRLCQISEDSNCAVRAQGPFGPGSHILHTQQLRVPDQALDQGHGDYPRARGLSRGGPGGVDGALFRWPRRGHPRRAVLVPDVVVRKRLPVIKVVAERALGVAASGIRSAALQGCAGREG
jgi:hypothetical protein